MGRVHVLGAVVLAGCSLVTPLGELTRGDSGSDAADASTQDASVDVVAPDAKPTCNPLAPFGAPVDVTSLNMDGSSSGSARLSRDELVVYFTADWPGGAGLNDLFVATRSTPAGPFGPAARLTGVNSASEDWDSTISGEGLTLYFGSTRVSPEHIFVATRSATTQPFVLPVEAPGLNVVDAGSMEPFVLPDHRAIYFRSNRLGGLGGSDIYRAEWLSGAFATPVHVANVSSAADEQLPTVSADELILLLGSDRAGGLGDVDIWLSRRSSSALPFDVPIDVIELSSTFAEYPSWVSDDGCRVLILSDRSDGKHFRIYEARRP